MELKERKNPAEGKEEKKVCPDCKTIMTYIEPEYNGLQPAFYKCPRCGRAVRIMSGKPEPENPFGGVIVKGYFDEIVGLVAEERIKQDTKWGEQNHNDLKWLSILVEEVGEVARDVTEMNPAVEYIKSVDWESKLKSELIQVMAVACAWLECLKRGKQNH